MKRKTSPSQPLRSHHRVTAKAPLASKVDRLKDHAMSQDVSLGGMALLLPRDVKVGDHLRFELELSDGDTCTLDGEICRVEDVGRKELHKVGLRWVNMSATRVAALDRYLRSLRATADGGVYAKS
jgi:c-di-GMP-binding flagellar brake protein YcgR